MSDGHLCGAEALTEAAAETLLSVSETEWLLHFKSIPAVAVRLENDFSSYNCF